MSGKDMSKYINWAKEQDCSKLFYTRDVMIEGLYKGDKEICQYVKAMHVGIDMFDTLLRKVQLLSFKVHECREIAAKSQWIPVSERLPDPDKHILVSFENFSLPMIGRYTVDDDDGGTFRVGDENESFIEHDLYVNAWMKLPECYKED